MRRTWWSRSLAMLLAAWFTVVMVEPAALHNCPVHGGTASGHVAPAPAPAGHPHSHAATMPGNGGNGHQHVVCTCIGACCAARIAGAAIPGKTVVVEVVAAEPARQAEPRREATPPDDDTEFLLPYPNGPPARVQVA